MNTSPDNQKFLWWKHGVLYQIYPRSFCDSDGDGIGDLAGLTRRLDYLKDLGIDGIWVSPIHPSPMKDFGYDIRDYRNIDPVFGTPGDFTVLVEQAHRRGIRIILDMVFNHTSSEHRWFIESRSSRSNPKRDWYIWHPGRKGRPPNNWRGAFGGSAWKWDEATGEYYLHLFLEEQPDLNWRNPRVRQELYSILRYWMNLGVDGFRFDVINFIVKDDQFRNNPYRLHRTLPRRFEQQDHMYDRCRPESHEYLRELRNVLDEFPERMSIGEVFPNEGYIDQETSAAYLGNGEDELHMVFDFSFNYARFKAREFAGILERQYAALPDGGWPAHVLSNHDQSRVMSRLAGGDEKRMKLLLTMLLTLRGTPFLYYGDEIGMGDVRVPRSRMQDPVGLRYWPLHPGRDRARTPMQWGDTPGFSTGDSWLPLSGGAGSRNVEEQKSDPDSILNHVRSLIGLRRSRVSLTRGSWDLIDTSDKVLAYMRKSGDEVTVMVLNFSPRPVQTPEIGYDLRVLASPVSGTAGVGDEPAGAPRIPGYGYLILGN